jgi:hypothetical protein
MYTGNLAATSNRIKWTFQTNITDPTTLAAVSLVGATIKVGLRTPGQSSCLLTGTNSDGHIVVNDAAGGIFTTTFTAVEMKTLTAGEYEFGMVIVFADGSEQQMIAAELPVVDGVVNP